MKERHATGKRLRKYYLECLKQILDDDKEAVKNDQNPRSNQEKMKVMEDSLRLPDEKDGEGKCLYFLSGFLKFYSVSK